MAGAEGAIETGPCELLEWDSEHFGFPIARVTGNTLTPESAEASDDWCSDRGIRCLYFTSDAGDADSARVAASHGYRIVDVRVIVCRSPEAGPRLPLAGPETVVVRDGIEDDLDYLRELAARSHHGSRFYFDGGFPRERCDSLYQAWVERGFSDPDRVLQVPVVDGEPAGYLVLAPRSPEREGWGELAAVDERQRGRGVGRALHVHCHRVLAARGALTLRGTISVRSPASLRLHERLGFLTDEAQICHHKWYD